MVKITSNLKHSPAGLARGKRPGIKLKKAPIIGRGPQADRYYIKEHVHNTYLYALLQSGVLGTAAFVGGLVWAWALFFQAILKKTAAQVGQHNMLLQTGGILAFFTVRSIPEVCGAMFGVDLMVMLPAMAYLSILNNKGEQSIIRHKVIYEVF